MSLNGHPPRASTIVALDKLEIRVKALTLHSDDIILISFSGQPSVNEVLDMQNNVAHLMSHLQTSVRVHWMMTPPGVTIEQVPAEQMEAAGWVRKESVA